MKILFSALMGVAVVFATGVCAAPQGSASASATIFKPVTITTVTNLSSGNVKTQGNNPSGTVTMPATFPLFASPQPSYTGGWAKNGANADAGTAARINLTGQPNAGFTVVVGGWTRISGDTPTAVGSNTFYSPNGMPTNSAHGVFNASGAATYYIGATLTIPRDNNGTTVVLRPNVTIVYD